MGYFQWAASTLKAAFDLSFFSVVLADEQSALHLHMRGKRDCITSHHYSECFVRFRSRKSSTHFGNRANACVRRVRQAKTLSGKRPLQRYGFPIGLKQFFQKSEKFISLIPDSLIFFSQFVFLQFLNLSNKDILFPTRRFMFLACI